MPERRAGTGIVGGKQEGKHECEAACACQADEEAENQSKADRQFCVSDQKGYRSGVRQDEVFEDGHHKWIGAALLQPLVDPELESAMKSELCAEDFVFAEDEEEDADGDAKKG